MKKYFGIILLILNWEIANCQSISRNEITTTGGTLTNSGNIINFSIGETVIPTLSNGFDIITPGFQQPGESLSVGNLPSTFCPGSTISIPYTAIDISGSNTYTAELSNASGSFSNPTIIGIKTGNSSGSMNVTIPATIAAGLNYHIRLKSSFPSLIASNISNSISIASKTKASLTTGNITGTTDACPLIATNNTTSYKINRVLNATEYLWTAPNNAEIVGPNNDTIVQIRFLSGFTTGSLQVQSKNACFNNVFSAPKTITITRILANAPVLLTGPTDPCPYRSGDSNAVYKIKSVLNANNYAWKVPSGATIVQSGNTLLVTPVDSLVTPDTSIVVNYSNLVATGSILIKVYSLTNCSQSIAKTLTLTRKIPLPPSSITASLTNICSIIGTTNTASYSIKKVTNATNYSWKIPTGAVIVQTGSTLLPNPIMNQLITTDTIIYVQFNSNINTGATIKVSAMNACSTSADKSLTLSSTLPPAPTSIISKQPIVAGNVCAYLGSTINLFTPSVTGAISYNWTVTGMGISIIGDSKSQFVTIFLDPTFTSGTIAVRSVSGCGQSISAKVLQLKATGCPTITKAKLNNENKIFDIKNTELIIYPNPTKGNFTIKWNAISKMMNGMITIENAGGQLVYQKAINKSNENVEINFDNLFQNGIYLVTIQSGSEKITKRLVISK